MQRIASMILAILLVGAPSAPAALRRPPAAPRIDRLCAAEIGRAVPQGTPAKIPAPCRRVGPIELGMQQAEVERRLGPPLATYRNTADASSPHRAYTATLYAFPVQPGALVRAGRARMRLAELRYQEGRLAAIDNQPGARIVDRRCPGGQRRPLLSEVEVSARAGPLLTWAGVTVGQPLTAVGRRFGRLPGANTSRDWYSYLPVPISFDVDPDRAVVTGFAIAADDRELTTSALPTLHLMRDPRTCSLVDIRFELGGN